MGKNRASVEAVLDRVKASFADEPRLAKIFETCYTNTLDTTVKKMEDGTTHVITGDIPANVAKGFYSAAASVSDSGGRR